MPQPRPSLAGHLEQLERAMEAGLGSLRSGTAPLMEELRQGVRALEPGPEGAKLAPKERQAWGARMVKAMDKLEDALEGLRLAARAQTRRD